MPDSQQTRILPDELRTSGLALGAVLRERYRLDSELGHGGMGTVYRATDLQLQRDVAVKVLSATSQTSEARERLIREARSAAALNHPHIVTIHDVGEASGFPFLVMELVQGPRLSQARPTDLARVHPIVPRGGFAITHDAVHAAVGQEDQPPVDVHGGARAHHAGERFVTRYESAGELAPRGSTVTLSIV